MADPTFKSLQSQNDRAGEFNRLRFLVSQMIADVNCATLVSVVSCTNSGGLSPVGRVNVLPLVNQIDANGSPVPHGTVFGIPYLRIQGGANAVIIDPEPGDIGIAVFCDQDVSTVKATKAAANPGSYRRHNYGDGMYLGGVLNGTPSQYVRFSAESIEMVSPTKIVLTAPDVQINASNAVAIDSPTLSQTGQALIDGLVKTLTEMQINALTLSNHVHTETGTTTQGPRN